MKVPDKAIDYSRLEITSPAFEADGRIPEKYTRDGENLSPPLVIDKIPKQALCLALVMEDSDVDEDGWTHWLAWNIPLTHRIHENDIHGVEGLNDFQHRQYRGPCPPSGLHHYTLKVYALDALMDIPVQSKKQQLNKAMSEHIVGYGELSFYWEANN